MGDLGWHIEEDKFIANAPRTTVRMKNIIATLDPDAPRRLILACHYDSKIMREVFYGATDSAVPCTMMLSLAHTMDPYLKLHKKKVSVHKYRFRDSASRWNNSWSVFSLARRNAGSRFSGYSSTAKKRSSRGHLRTPYMGPSIWPVVGIKKSTLKGPVLMMMELRNFIGWSVSYRLFYKTVCHLFRMEHLSMLKVHMAMWKIRISLIYETEYVFVWWYIKLVKCIHRVGQI